jgi:hypothetical protein
MKKFIFILLIAVVGCTNTKMSGVVDPNYAGSFKSQKIVVIGKGMTIEEQKSLEKSVNKNFANYQVQTVSSLQLFPLTRSYSEDDYYKIAIRNGIDSILVVNVDERGENKEYVPPNPNSESSKGYTVTKKYIRFTLKLINPKNKDNIWIAQGRTTGGKFRKIAYEVAERAGHELLNAGIISKR